MSNKLKLKIKYILLFILIIICTYAVSLANSRYLSSKTIGYLSGIGFNTLCRKIRKEINWKKRQIGWNCLFFLYIWKNL